MGRVQGTWWDFDRKCVKERVGWISSTIDPTTVFGSWPNGIFQQEIRQFNSDRENILHENRGQVNNELNVQFTEEAVENIKMKAKSCTAPGLGGLVADVFKIRCSSSILMKLFNKCMFTSMILSTCCKGFISLIPKSKTSDPVNITQNICLSKKPTYSLMSKMDFEAISLPWSHIYPQ